MQNKGLIKVFAILFGLVSLYQLSFTFLATKVEDDAIAYAKNLHPEENVKEIAKSERKYLDSVANKKIIDLGIASYSYDDVKDKEMNLGLDLKGGINAILQISVKEVLISLSNDSKNEAFNKALAAADEAQKNSNANYLDLFFEEFEPSIQRIGNSGRIQIELPGARDIDRVIKLITSKAELQFWEVHTNAEVQNFFFEANAKVAELLNEKTVNEQENDTIKKDLHIYCQI